MSSNQLSTAEPPQTLVPWAQVEKFVGQVSHDLRNGLNACELQLSLLTEMVSDPEAVVEVKQLRQSLGGITKQLQSLRLLTTASTPHPLEYPATDLFEDLRERFQRSATQNASRVTWLATVNNQQTVLVDPEATLSALLELLGNATQFGEQGGQIQCELREQAGRMIFRVAHKVDSPPTVPLDQWGLIPLNSTRRGAYGLGLFRARRIFHSQGAELSFQHEMGTGLLTASVTLPAKPL